jgi:dTDP-4-dehydrorhamnose 3,5-epimerase-like enzyme
MGIFKCQLIDLPKIADPRGSLTFVENGSLLTFTIQRVYFLYDVPEETARGFHAHRQLQQLLIALNGSFEVLLDDGQRRETVTLNRPDQGLYVGPMIWREMANFSTGAICLVLASMPYDEADYIRSYDEFTKLVQEKNS